jgi:hypothetical protein
MASVCFPEAVFFFAGLSDFRYFRRRSALHFGFGAKKASTFAAPKHVVKSTPHSKPL